jgi:hypothetical protein
MSAEEVKELIEQYEKEHKYENFYIGKSSMPCKYAVRIIKGSWMDYDYCLKRGIYLTTPEMALFEMVPYKKGRFLGFRTVETESGWWLWKRRERRDIPTFEQIHPCQDCGEFEK